jgi:hypothetical protein
MKTQQIQFNRQKVAAFLLAGLILALAAGLAWAGADASGSTVQPAKMVQCEAYSPQSGHPGPSAAEVDCPGTDFSGGDSGLPSEFHRRAVKGSKPSANPGQG